MSSDSRIHAIESHAHLLKLLLRRGLSSGARAFASAHAINGALASEAR